MHRARVSGITGAGLAELSLPPHMTSGDYAVGDWVLADPDSLRVHRRLERKTVLARRSTDGSVQVAAANIDALLIVTSCNADFNSARLERYLALANQAGIRPLIVLTKADTATDADAFVAEATALQRDLPVVVVDPRLSSALSVLSPWCGPGQTVALVGSSGVGKSTLTNTLAGSNLATPQATGDTRAGDDKGRHTTTSRSLHPIAGGGWVIDTPGIRSLHMSEIAEGLDVVFAEIAELTANCKFRDCSHTNEPGCAVQAALAGGSINPERLARWRKLGDENGERPDAPRGPAGSGKPTRRRKRSA